MISRRFALCSTLVVIGSLGHTRAARGGDVTVFVGEPSPGEGWGRAYGAAVMSSVVPFIGFEGEASRVSGSTLDTSMTAFTASAVVSPPLGFVTPYGGAGAGVFRQTLAGGITDTGRLTALFAGLKVKTAGILVLKAEYRKLSFSGDPPIKLDSRIAVGAGVSF